MFPNYRFDLSVSRRPALYQDEPTPGVYVQWEQYFSPVLRALFTDCGLPLRRGIRLAFCCLVAEAEAKARNSVAVTTKGNFTWIVWALLLALGIPTVWMLRGRVQSEAAATSASQVRSVLHLETFVLNLADPNERAYLRVGIDLGLTTELQPNERSANPPVALLRDTILGVLSLAKPQDLVTPQGKTKLKDDLLRALRGRAPALGVQEVYFTEFLVQR